MTIYLQPLGDVDEDVLMFVDGRIKDIWPVQRMPAAPVPEGAYRRSRRQFEGVTVLRSLPVPGPGDVILGVVDEDIFARGLNFIFGVASGNRALISLTRLSQEFYRLPGDPDLLKLRALKEAMHEIGHAFGLDHCADPRCVMHFSNIIEDTDYKGWMYCKECGLPPGIEGK